MYGDRIPKAAADGQIGEGASRALLDTDNPAAALTLTKPQLLGLLAGHGLDGIEQDGDPAVLAALLSVLSEFDKSFPIVTP